MHPGSDPGSGRGMPRRPARPHRCALGQRSSRSWVWDQCSHLRNLPSLVEIPENAFRPGSRRPPSGVLGYPWPAGTAAIMGRFRPSQSRPSDHPASACLRQPGQRRALRARVLSSASPAGDAGSRTVWLGDALGERSSRKAAARRAMLPGSRSRGVVPLQCTKEAPQPARALGCRTTSTHPMQVLPVVRKTQRSLETEREKGRYDGADPSYRPVLPEAD